MFICSLDALKKSSKKKETRIQNKIVEVSQQTSYRRKKTGKKKIGMMKFLVLTVYLFDRLTLILISAYAITGMFLRSKFSEGNYLCILYTSIKVSQKTI